MNKITFHVVQWLYMVTLSNLTYFAYFNHEYEQKCIPVGCIPPAAVAVQGGLPQAPLQDQAPLGPGTPQDRAPPWDQVPLPGPGTSLGPGTPTLQEQAPPVNRMTNRCKNITFPQTSFAGGKNYLPEVMSYIHGTLHLYLCTIVLQVSERNSPNTLTGLKRLSLSFLANTHKSHVLRHSKGLFTCCE